jgi:sugar/nucleoside kinase (ribokinase family)
VPEPVAPKIAPNATPTANVPGAAPRRVVMIGPVTWDEIDGERLPGGPLSFAARAAEAFGARLQFVVLAGPDADLSALSEHEVVVVEGTTTLKMDHHVVDGERSIRVPITPERVIEAADVPEAWFGCSDLVLAPLMPLEMNAAAIAEAVAAERLWVLAQGFQRVHAADGTISFLDRPAAVLDELSGPATSVFLSTDETEPWSEGDVEALASRCARVIVTQGSSGAVVLSPRGGSEIAPAPAAVVDTTGAGDVFATAFLLAFDHDADEAAAGRLAAGFAAASIELAGPQPLPSRAEIEARLKGGAGSEWQTGGRA